jgi:hypothetical protein
MTCLGESRNLQAFRLGHQSLTMNTPAVPDLLSTLVAELQRPREVSSHVINHIIETYGISRDEIGDFLNTDLVALEDYEIDLILSPLFTPSLRDQSIFAELLERDSVPVNEWPALVQQLASRPTHAQLVTDDSNTHSIQLREVTIERYVHRLRLEATIPESLLQILNDLVPASDRAWLKAIARRAVWSDESRRNILARYLTSAVANGTYRLDDAMELLKVVETYQCANVAELLAQIPHWQQVLRQEINEASTGKPFFNERVEELHGGGRDKRRQDRTRIQSKENERAFLERLQQALA